MRLIDYFRTSKKTSAVEAKERLQVIIAHGRMSRGRGGPDYFPRMKQELLAVIMKYTHAETDDIKVSLEQEGGYEILELNVTIPNK